MTILEILIEKGYNPTGNYQKDVFEAEEKLGLKIAADFREYLENYGQLTIEASELTGVSTEEYLNVVNATKEERQYLLPKYHDMYVIENLGVNGIVIWQNSSGEIFQTIPESNPEKIHNSFSEYLLQEVLLQE